MVLVVEHIHEVSIERMNIVEAWKIIENLLKTFMESGLGKFDFAHVKCANACDGQTLVDDGRCLALDVGEHGVNKHLRCWHGLDAPLGAEGVPRHPVLVLSMMMMEEEDEVKKSEEKQHEGSVLCDFDLDFD